MPNSRVIFSILKTKEGLSACVSRAPINVKDTILSLPLAAPGPLDTQAQIDLYGANIRDTLNTHVEIRSVLDSLQKAPVVQNWDILFEISSAIGDVAEAIRWEVIRDGTGQYMLLSGNRHIFRVAADPSCPDLSVVRILPDPINFVAFLSPAGVVASDELVALTAAVSAANKAGLNVALTAYVADRELLASPQPANVVCKPLPDSTLNMQIELKGLKPHLLHFFCHGQSDPLQHLEFATILDKRNNAANGSVLFSIDRLVQSEALTNAWTVVFNCCEGARPASLLNSMAFRVVAEKGVPSAIGMGAPFPVGAAPLFSQAFYTAFFAGLAQAIAASNNRDVFTVDFGAPIDAGRQALHDAFVRQSVTFRCWALPIIYLHRNELNLQKPAVAAASPAEIAKRALLIAGVLQALPATTPAPARRDILALFDQPPSVPVELRCDENGRFPMESRNR